MRKDFHYYCIKTLAYYAGFTQEAAEIIAYASQSVDEEDDNDTNNFYKSLPTTLNKYSNQLSLDKENRKQNRFEYIRTQTMVGAIQHINRFEVLIPFHFIPAESCFNSSFKKEVGSISAENLKSKNDNETRSNLIKQAAKAISENISKSFALIITAYPNFFTQENSAENHLKNFKQAIVNYYDEQYNSSEIPDMQSNILDIVKESIIICPEYWVKDNNSSEIIVEIADYSDYSFITKAASGTSLIDEFMEKGLDRFAKVATLKLEDKKIMQIEAIAALIKLGIMLHTYADTWAHQDFSGRFSEIENDVDNVTVFVDESSITEETQRLSTEEDDWIYSYDVGSFFEKRINIGHANAGKYPDYSQAILHLDMDDNHDEDTSYNNKISFGKGSIKARNNTIIFLEAAQDCFDYLKNFASICKKAEKNSYLAEYANNPSTKDWDDLKNDIGTCFATSHVLGLPGYQLGSVWVDNPDFEADSNESPMKEVLCMRYPLNREYDENNFYLKPNDFIVCTKEEGIRAAEADETPEQIENYDSIKDQIKWSHYEVYKESSLREKQSKWRSVFSTIFKDDPYYIDSDINKDVWENYIKSSEFKKAILWPLFFREAKDQRDFFLSTFPPGDYSLKEPYQDKWLEYYNNLPKK